MNIRYLLAVLLGLLVYNAIAFNPISIESIAYENTVDTLKISVGQNKRVQIICPSEEGLNTIRTTDINALVKATYERIAQNRSNAKTIEIEFDETGDSKLIISANSIKEFKELVDLDYNKMIELTGLYNHQEKGDDKIVVDRLTTEHFKLKKDSEAIDTKEDASPFVRCTPRFVADTVIERDVAVVTYWDNNLKNVGTQNQYYARYCYSAFMLDWGVNNYLEDWDLPVDELYKVRYWGSWYFSMKYNYTHHFGRTNRSPLGFSLWSGIDWYNFKFEDHDVRLQNSDPRFYSYPDEDGGYSRKSKLTVPYFTVGFMPEIFMGGTRMAIGVYGGIKMGAHAKYKIKGTDEKNKQKDHSIHDLTKYRYGARFEFGDRTGDWAFFAQYDESTLFDDEYSPELNPITIGLTFKFNGNSFDY